MELMLSLDDEELREFVQSVIDSQDDDEYPSKDDVTELIDSYFTDHFRDAADVYVLDRLDDVDDNPRNGCRLNRAFHDAVRKVIDGLREDGKLLGSSEQQERIKALEEHATYLEERFNETAALLAQVMTGLVVSGAQFIINLPDGITQPVLDTILAERTDITPFRRVQHFKASVVVPTPEQQPTQGGTTNEKEG